MIGFPRAFFGFWWDFIVGDDWTLAAGTVLTLLLAGLVNRAEGELQLLAWPIAPIGIVLTLYISVGRAVRSSARED